MLRHVQIGAIIIALAGCSQADSGSAQDKKSTSRNVTRWNTSANAAYIAIGENELAESMREAIRAAQASLDQARVRWLAADETSRGRWQIKWAAPVEQGNVEYLWVQPLSWSQFRIEGYLLNEPQHALESGAQVGDIVSFPSEEIADWVHWKDQDRHEKEGGYTIDVLSKTFGAPPPRRH